MATGFAPAVADGILDAIANGEQWTPPAAFYLQLHTGDPGAAGTANVAGNATRKQVSFAAASSGNVSNDAAIEWTTEEVDTAEAYTHWTAWDASTSGNFILSGVVTANAVITGDTFTIPIGALDITLSVAA